MFFLKQFLTDIFSNKKVIKKGIVALLGVGLIGSLSLNLVLADKMVRQAYSYEDNLLEVKPIIVESLSKDVLDDYLNKEFTNENGKYTGERVNGKKEGTGIYTWNDGSVYEGEFSNDQINGEGKLTIPGKGTYNGEFVNGKKSGSGTYEFVNGDKYVGNWSNDVMSGYGTYTFSNGDKYVGQFSDNKFNGQGTYTSNGSKYSGKWINNQYQK